MQKNTIKDWAADDQPRQKLLLKGAENLSDSELLAILINNGVPGKSALELAKELLAKCNQDLNTMGRCSVQSLCKLKIKGLGQAKAIHITAALELGLRRHISSVKKEVIRSSGDIADYLRAKLAHKAKEVFGVLFLNRSNKVIAFEQISEGGITGTVVDIRIILKKALLHESVSMVICHNHPSGSLDPSTADEMITQKIKEAGMLLDIRLLDHIIVSTEGHYSFADHGKI
ncbi:MAG: repair protein RadC [Bacteroidota bacterium]|jgi:DNA repair protein RadC